MLLVGLAVLAAGCALAGQPRVMVRNETTVPISVQADDLWIGTVAAGATAELAFPLGDEPTDIQASTPSGATVADLLGTRAMYDAAIAGSNPMSTWQDMACGRVVLAVGPFDPSLLDPLPSPTGPCP